MNRNLTWLFVLPLVFGLCHAAGAQQLLMPRIGGYTANQTETVSNPVISPYLLMTEAGQTGLLNYQTLVQPIMQQRQLATQQNASIQRLQQQVQTGQASPGRRPGQNIRDTGHETRRFNYSHFYNSANPY